ncbi:MAG TPA: Asp-tRNA(Asn)/Glu-tRNA(Gln) amidotransferase subunit GatB [Nitrospiria bacterium]|nr:Asp-tRNA(Asn)/Glu-tRNA(Gln) amidotransferase subunit GatB [Nitrospiria bacterium]
MPSTTTEFETVVGMEVHAQLKTATKIFCGCSTRFGAGPNEQTCPVCLGLPGALPVLNARALDMAIRAGLAMNCRINPVSRFARKNYFYPDLPKGYQISQFELPVCEKGYLDVSVNGESRRIRIRRIHLEEDAGKNLHEGLASASHVDLNRAGVPLIEIVTEPDIRSAEEGVAYLKALRDILIYLDVCDGNMEEGSLRCEPNLSLRPAGQKEYGTRVEMKNINSFKFAQKAMEYEIRRQQKLLQEGGKVSLETRLWNTEKEITVVMRGKEEAHDYRYFPEPDLVPVKVSQEMLVDIRKDLPELPGAKRERFVRDYGIPEYDAEVLTGKKELAHYFEICLTHFNQPKKVSNWMMSELLRELKKDNREVSDCPIPPESLAALLMKIEDGTISGKIAKTVFEEMYRTGKSAESIIEKKGLVQVTDEGAINQMIAEVLEAHPKETQSYKDGKTQLLGFFVGQVMKKSRGKANPAKANELLRKALE